MAPQAITNNTTAPPHNSQQQVTTRPNPSRCSLEPTKKSTASMYAVTNTPELLENILIHLSTKTLLLSQRVNKQFHGTITGSRLLQQALFFRLASTNGSRFGREGINDLLIQESHPNAIAIYFAKPRGKARPRPCLEIGSKLVYASKPGRNSADMYQITFRLTDIKDRTGAGNESWRRMYVMQGAMEEVMTGWDFERITGGVADAQGYGLPPYTLNAGEMYERALRPGDFEDVELRTDSGQ